MENDLANSLIKLDDLLSSGVITAKEHQTRKDKLIERFMSGGDTVSTATAANPNTDADKVLCSTHNRPRSVTNLQQVVKTSQKRVHAFPFQVGTMPDGTPKYACSALSQCKLPGTIPAAPMGGFGGKGAWVCF